MICNSYTLAEHSEILWLKNMFLSTFLEKVLTIFLELRGNWFKLYIRIRGIFLAFICNSFQTFRCIPWPKIFIFTPKVRIYCFCYFRKSVFVL